MAIVTTFALMVFGHALADYPLQGEFLAKAKSRYAPVPGVPYYHALGAHAVIHAGIVGLISGSLLLALFEFLLHGLIDDAKCAGRLTFDQDQALHIACKGLWCGMLAVLGPLP